MRYFANLLLFQIGWFACVLGAVNRIFLLGPIVVLVVISVHLFWSNRPSKELVLIGLTALLGAGWDSLLVLVGFVTYPSGTIINGLAPYWIIMLWMLFATTLNVSLPWLREKVLLSLLLGAFFGPLAYYVGVQLGGIVFLNLTASLLSIAVGWSVILPTLIALSVRFDGISISVEGNCQNV